MQTANDKSGNRFFWKEDLSTGTDLSTTRHKLSLLEKFSSTSVSPACLLLKKKRKEKKRRKHNKRAWFFTSVNKQWIHLGFRSVICALVMLIQPASMLPNVIQTQQLAVCQSARGRDPHQNLHLGLITQALSICCRVPKEWQISKSLLATYLPSYRHTCFQLGVCTYKQLAMAAYWSGSVMLTASQERHKLLMNDTHNYNLAMTAHSGTLKVFRCQWRSKIKQEAWIIKTNQGSCAMNVWCLYTMERIWISLYNIFF